MSLAHGFAEIHAENRPDILAFRVTGALDQEGLHAMGERANEWMDGLDGKGSMLLIFDVADAGDLPTGSFDWEMLKSRFRALVKLEHYVVANAPGAAGPMVEAMGKVMPLEARSFDTSAEAWAFLNARPA
ncbi:MAG: STAS/SEC14 domain-containing protein [Hasllibacter sp.]